ncbi:oxidoreductase [Histidinibacterium lentulum]|uniref:SDR family oxidoreductase n=1 Tax=Histidinibacterium lentulum TaxID=2480588 RepID=A0A3N2R5B6_9RHOB|nr:oxidoreductase [Histidinibacterium lentulum]ROU02593.1 SDR family oxidoreductase [Histidinibacterium lentulum]
MEVRLDGRAVVITGAASGIGAAIAAEAARAGGRLCLTDIDDAGLSGVAAELSALGAEIATVVADLSDAAAPARVAADARARFGRIDGLVNAAGLTTRAGLADAMPETWDHLFAVNGRAPFFLMQEAVRDMRARGAAGSIVNILSVNAHVGLPDLAVYSGSKGALSTLTKNAANAHMADLIRVNGINLGWVATEAEHHMQSVVLGKGPDWLAEAAATRPAGRLVEAGEAGRLAVWLLSDASRPMTGMALDLEYWVAGSPP